MRRARPAVLVDITRSARPRLRRPTPAAVCGSARCHAGGVRARAGPRALPMRSSASRSPATRDPQPRHGRRVDRPRGPARRAAAGAARPRRGGRGRERRRAADDRGGGPLHRAVRERAGAPTRSSSRPSWPTTDDLPGQAFEEVAQRHGDYTHRLGRGRSAHRGRGRRVGAGRRRRRRRPAAARPGAAGADRPGGRRRPAEAAGAPPPTRSRTRSRTSTAAPPTAVTSRACSSRGRRGARGAGGRMTAPVDEVVAVEVTVNGRRYRELVEPRLLLSDFLRHRLGLTGTHVGCEHGVCGACTVRLDGAAVRSCLLLAVQADGSDDRDGRRPGRDGRAHRAPAGLPGAPRAAVRLLHAGRPDGGRRPARRGEPATRAEVERLLSGHLCRCTGYEPIVAAILETAERRRARREPRPQLLYAAERHRTPRRSSTAASASPTPRCRTAPRAWRPGSATSASGAATASPRCSRTARRRSRCTGRPVARRVVRPAQPPPRPDEAAYCVEDAGADAFDAAGAEAADRPRRRRARSPRRGRRRRVRRPAATPGALDLDERRDLADALHVRARPGRPKGVPALAPRRPRRRRSSRSSSTAYGRRPHARRHAAVPHDGRALDARDVARRRLLRRAGRTGARPARSR